MAKPRTPNQKKAYAALKGRLNQYSYLVQTVYDTLNAEAARLALSTGYTGEREFRWSDYPQTQKRVADLQARFVGDIGSVVYAGTSREWKESNIMQDLLATKALKSYRAQVNGRRVKVYYQPNNDAMKAFQERADRGMNLSAKLWNQSGNYKQELEYAISAAIEKGMSAVTLSKRVSRYLNDFPALKADYKERYGHAVECFDCEYRSIRLARTEINMAYRTAEQKRWQQFDFVLGYEIKLSGSHPVTDICDELKGRYPKDFHFVGWHPACMCYCVPILKTEDEFWADDDAPSVNAVADVPQNFKEWIENNKQRVKYHTTVPYFVEDNPKYVSKDFIDGIGTLVPKADAGIITDLKDAVMKLKDPTYVTEREVKKMINDFADANPTLFYGGLKSISVTRAKSADFYMGNTRYYKKTDGSYHIANGNTLKIANKDFGVGSGGVFNPLLEVKSAMRAIAENRRFTFNEEYALECLWHEFRHAAAKGWSDYYKKTDELTIVMETVNQFCARRSYGQFVKAIGGKVSHKKEIIENGYGYKRWVGNFEKILKHCNISKSSAYIYLRNRILSTPYEDMMEEVVELLVNRGGLKRQKAISLVKGVQLSEKAFEALLTSV